MKFVIVLFAVIAAAVAVPLAAGPGEIQVIPIPFDSADDIVRYKKSVYGGASHGGYEAPAPALHPGPATSYSYQSHAPTVPCAKNLLVSCSPSVAPVPCAAPSYGHGHGSSY